MNPIETNQPQLDHALARIASIVDRLGKEGVPPHAIAFFGFSQGACLTLEYCARHAARFGAILALSGGLIGSEGTQRGYTGSFEGTPVFLGSGDPDPHVPFSRVLESSEVFERMGARVDLRRYPGMPHTINEDEIGACRTLLQEVRR